MAATAADEAADEVYNVAFGERTSLNDLYRMIREHVAPQHPAAAGAEPVHRDFRAGDVRHSLADISKAGEKIGYAPEFSIAEGLDQATNWYLQRFR
jgi:UDP-N-acetylglucosamine 4-epimerase